MNHHLTPLDLVLAHSPEQQTHVVARTTLIQDLAEHLHSRHYCLAFLLLDPHDLHLLPRLDHPPLDPARGHRTPTCDRKNILHRHQKRLVDVPIRRRNVAVDRVHQLHHLLFPLRLAIQGPERRTQNHRELLARKLVLHQEFAHLHLDEFEEFFVIDQIDLVHEHDDVGHAHLACQQDVLARLGHRPVGGIDHQDGAVHLGCSGDHVFDVVGVAGAVDVGVVSVLGFVLDVGRGDGDAAFAFFGGVVDGVEGADFGAAEAFVEHLGDGGGEGGFSVVDVADGADVDVGFGSLKMRFGHGLAGLYQVVVVLSVGTLVAPRATRRWKPARGSRQCSWAPLRRFQTAW